MAVPQANYPAYVVYRDVPLGEALDATSTLSFFPPKGSDELFDALREAFPLLKTHSERMRDAIIQFLLEERQQEQFELSPATTMESSQITWPSTSSGSASCSPDLLNFATPASLSDSPQLQQASTATSSQPSPPSLDQMTGVFSLSSDHQPRQRIRRKMTEAEKIEYRKRRIVKACPKCARRKRKCPHNQAEMKTVMTPSTKSTSPLSTSSTKPSDQQPDPHSLLTFDESFDPTAFGSFGDFNMFDDPLAEVSVDDFFDFDHFENTTTLFNNNEYQSDAQQLRQHNAPAYAPQNHGRGVLSRSTNSYRDMESQIRSQTQSPSYQSVLLPTSQIQIQDHALQRAVRDARTDGLLFEPESLSVSAERQSGRVTDRARSELSNASGPSQQIHGHGSGSNCGDMRLSESTNPVDIHLQRPRPSRSSRPQEIASTSTSVSTLSGSSATRSVTLQGRPQPARLSNTLVSSEQMSVISEGGTRPGPLGAGGLRNTSLATELFMLRRRLPRTHARQIASSEGREGTANALPQTKPSGPTSRGHQCSEQLSAQANGGAYLQDGVESSASTHTSRRTYRGGRAGLQIATSGQDVISVSATQSTLIAQADRLSDHVRYRDHPGQQQVPGQGSPQFVCALAALLLLAMFSPSIFALGLVLFLTIYLSETAGNLDGVMQCTTTDSSWPSTRANCGPSPDTGFQVLKERQYIRGSSSSIGEGLYAKGSGAWLMGLMYPFRLAPLLFSFQ